MVFVCASIKTAKAILKPWYARSVLEEKTRLCDVFLQLATGAFDGGTGIGDEFQNTLDLTFRSSLFGLYIVIEVPSH